MPDLPSRRQREAEIAAALLLLFNRWEHRDWDTSAFQLDFQAELQNHFANAYVDAAGQFATQQGVELEVADQATRWEAQFLPVLAGEVAKTTPGLPGAFSAERAALIAATEVTRTITSAEIALGAYLLALPPEAGGRKLEPHWWTEDDDDVCPVCRRLHGKSKDEWPPEAGDGPPIHPTCRCWLTWEEVS